MTEIPNLNSLRGSIRSRLLAWLFSRRIMRKLLIAAGIFITLVSVIYIRVNIHGRNEWEQYKREMVAKGDVFDWSAYVPAPVPDDQNIFKAPKMEEWFGDNRSLLNQPLEDRITNSFAQRFFNTNSKVEITTSAAAAAFVAWSDQFQADFDIIGEALKRPYARISGSYSQAASITLPNVASLYAVVKTLTQRAKCELLLGHVDAAWRDLKLLRSLVRMVEGQGRFITTEGDWMRRELARHELQVIARGTELHAWLEPQLVVLQEQLRGSDFIALHVEALKCGRALLVSAAEDGSLLKEVFAAGGDSFWSRLKAHPFVPLFFLVPRGALYERATSISQSFERYVKALTPADGVLRPEASSKAFSSWKRAQEGLPSLLRTQTLVNEGQIACALERYRLVHGNYPQKLDDLVPQFIKELPRDIINGQPLVYRLQAEGSFILYSVGWNEKDDGGIVTKADGDRTKWTEADWVWKSYMY